MGGPDGDGRHDVRTALMDNGQAAPADGRQRLVVVGNGMAGARTVEEILSRGGNRLFSILIFGDEPYGLSLIHI